MIETINAPEDIKAIYSEFVEKYYSDPSKMVIDIFKANPTKQQDEVLKALAKFKKVSVRAGHGVGKSSLASWAVYWFLLTRPYPKIICTAPTFHQLYDILWAEAAYWRQHSDLVTELFDWKQRRIEAKWAPENWWAAARTASKGESLTGRHAGHFMLIVDEASGVDDSLFKASEGMLTGENSYVLLISNPTKNSGYFYDSHNKDRATWKTFKLSCYDSQIKDGGLVDTEWIKNMEVKYRETDPNHFGIRVLGEFPHDEPDSLIPHNWVLEAQNREMVTTDEPLFMGLDVGAGGDLSAIVLRRGGKVEPILTNKDKNTMNVMGWAAKIAVDKKVDAIFVDPIGIGKGAYDRLEELGFQVYPVDVRYTARKTGFKKLRDELWWTVREQFEKGLISIPEDDDLRIELSAIKYHTMSDGVKIESKDEMKRGKLKRSPDRGDALCMTYYIEDNVFSKMKEMEDEEEEDKHMIIRSRWTGY